MSNGHIKRKKFERNVKAEHEQIRKIFNEQKGKWLDEVLRKLVPPVVYEQLLARNPWSLDEVARRGIFWKPVSLRENDPKTAVVEFGLFRKGHVGQIAKGFDFVVTHDGQLKAIDVAEILAPGTKDFMN